MFSGSEDGGHLAHWSVSKLHFTLGSWQLISQGETAGL